MTKDRQPGKKRVHTLVLFFVEMVQTTSVETGGTTNNAMYLIAFL